MQLWGPPMLGSSGPWLAPQQGLVSWPCPQLMVEQRQGPVWDAEESPMFCNRKGSERYLHQESNLEREPADRCRLWTPSCFGDTTPREECWSPAPAWQPHTLQLWDARVAPTCPARCAALEIGVQPPSRYSWMQLPWESRHSGLQLPEMPQKGPRLTRSPFSFKKPHSGSFISLFLRHKTRQDRRAAALGLGALQTSLTRGQRSYHQLTPCMNITSPRTASPGVEALQDPTRTRRWEQQPARSTRTP